MSARDLEELDAMIEEASRQLPTAVRSAGLQQARPGTGRHRLLSKPSSPPARGGSGAATRGRGDLGSQTSSPPTRAGGSAAAAPAALPVSTDELESLELAMEREYSRELQVKVEALQAALAAAEERQASVAGDDSRARRDAAAAVAEATARAEALAQRNAELEQRLATERAASARAAAEVARLEAALAAGAAPQQQALENLAAALAASEARAAEERARVAEVKRLWKGVVDTMREEADALATALDDAQAEQRRLEGELARVQQQGRAPWSGSAPDPTTAAHAVLGSAAQQLAELAALRAEVARWRAGAGGLGPASDAGPPVGGASEPSLAPLLMTLTPTREETPLPPSPLQSARSTAGEISAEPGTAAAAAAAARYAVVGVKAVRSGAGAAASAAQAVDGGVLGAEDGIQLRQRGGEPFTGQRGALVGRAAATAPSTRLATDAMSHAHAVLPPPPPLMAAVLHKHGIALPVPETTPAAVPPASATIAATAEPLSARFSAPPAYTRSLSPLKSSANDPTVATATVDSSVAPLAVKRHRRAPPPPRPPPSVQPSPALLPAPEPRESAGPAGPPLEGAAADSGRRSSGAALPSLSSFLERGNSMAGGGSGASTDFPESAASCGGGDGSARSDNLAPLHRPTLQHRHGMSKPPLPPHPQLPGDAAAAAAALLPPGEVAERVRAALDAERARLAVEDDALLQRVRLLQQASADVVAAGATAAAPGMGESANWHG